MSEPEKSHSFAKLGVDNSRGKPLVVAVEPWADDFTLMPGESLEIIASGDTDDLPWFYVVEWDDTFQVYCNATANFQVLQNGIALKCGHKRQP